MALPSVFKELIKRVSELELKIESLELKADEKSIDTNVVIKRRGRPPKESKCLMTPKS